MKHIVSISLGSSARNAKAEVSLGGAVFLLERVGTDGDAKRALELIRAYSGSVDAMGLGGTDLYIYAGKRRYTFRESKAFLRAAGATPLFDGSGLKHTLERKVIFDLQKDGIVDFKKSSVLLVCGVDRFGMAEALDALGGEVVYGDLLFGLQLPIALKKLSALQFLARMIAPVITKMPIRWFYPVGTVQEERKPKRASHFQRADIIAGDFHFIRRNMPEDMTGKTIVTNTVTPDDRRMLKESGVKLLITTTPEFGGRSFGTNLMEAMIYSACPRGGNGACDYSGILDMPELKPSINYLNSNRV